MGMWFDFFEDIGDAFKEFTDTMIHITDDSYVSPYTKKSDAKKIIEEAALKLDTVQANYQLHYDKVKAIVEKNYKTKKILLGKFDDSSIDVQDSMVLFDTMVPIRFEQNMNFRLAEFLGIFGESIRDKAASAFLEDAKDYDMRVNAICARIKAKDVCLDKIEAKIVVEEKLLSVLYENYQSKMSERNQISLLIKRLMLNDIVDSQGNIKQDYLWDLERLKNTLY